MPPDMALIRVRKYRVFVAVAAISLLTLYFLSKQPTWYTSDPFADLPSYDRLPKQSAHDGAGNAPAGGDRVAHGEVPPPVVPVGSKPPDIPPPASKDDGGDDDGPGNDDWQEDPGPPRWKKKDEKFPVAAGSVIQLPKGTSKQIPKIQFEFGPESEAAKSDRRAKLVLIKDTMVRTWEGYRAKAWMKDELRPETGRNKEHFGGWGATLIDSLDTLHIMGMTTEFEEAVEATKKVDFTTSGSETIPMFETTIRYLGGLLGGYDVSGRKHKVLLDKAVELADILIGAFDTPNRMPILFYDFAGDRGNNPERASRGSVLAELGTLSVEFTRLAQITKQPKYYDAVARITNRLQEWQNETSLPGLWPVRVDASGCAYDEEEISADEPEPSPAVGDSPAESKDTSTFGTDRIDQHEEPEPDSEELRRQKDKSSFGEKGGKHRKRDILVSRDSESCPSGRIGSSSYGSSDSYTLGSEADSTFEYLPKEYLLLGGLNDQYRTMYEAVIATVKKYLVFRPMIKDENRKILFTGKYRTHDEQGKKEHKRPGTLQPSVGHLTCFQGGMVGLAAKIWNRKGELELAKRLTDGCVWAYESAPSGIMPEEFTPMMCAKMDHCPWNETAWFLELDPLGESRTEQALKAQNEAEEEAKTEGSGANISNDGGISGKVAPNDLPTSTTGDGPSKRQLDDSSETDEHDAQETETPTRTLADTHRINRPLTHREFVDNKIEVNNIWPGVADFGDKRYLLRPEAIESVFYMYRITGDEYWREKGWKMFQDVENFTKVRFGNSAVADVTSHQPFFLDEMESFWIAETLKYFYLLQCDPNYISLDDYVFNTEAHPLLRPDSKILKA